METRNIPKLSSEELKEQAIRTMERPTPQNLWVADYSIPDNIISIPQLDTYLYIVGFAFKHEKFPFGYIIKAVYTPERDYVTVVVTDKRIGDATTVEYGMLWKHPQDESEIEELLKRCALAEFIHKALEVKDAMEHIAEAIQSKIKKILTEAIRKQLS